jgi:hypothetical protein
MGAAHSSPVPTGRLNKPRSLVRQAVLLLNHKSGAEPMIEGALNSGELGVTLKQATGEDISNLA